MSRTPEPETGESLGDLLEQLPEDLARQAFTHASWVDHRAESYERLAFLGDSVLGLIVTSRLYSAYPDLSEGRLAKLRAAVVNARALADVARNLDLGPHIRLGRGEETTGGRDKSSILSDTLEAILGAVYLQFGFARAADVVLSLFDPLITAAAQLGAGLDWKTSLQELGADTGLGVPEYLLTETGPDHEKTFTAQVRVGEQVYGRGVGRSKKAAEQQAAETAWREIRATVESLDGEPLADDSLGGGDVSLPTQA